MVESLERTAETGNSVNVLEREEYPLGKSYSAFAEMYLETPLNPQAAKVTCTVCTWRKIPTIDDW